jgi:hypothetical protein
MHSPHDSTCAVTSPGGSFSRSTRVDGLTRPSRLSTTAVYSALASERGGRECERSLRVTCGRRFIGDQLDAGIDVVTVQQMAGHAKVSTTTGYDRGD